MVTIERFVAVEFPLQKLKNTKILLSISIIGSLIYNIPRFLEYEYFTIYTDGNGIITTPPNITTKLSNEEQVVFFTSIEIFISFT